MKRLFSFMMALVLVLSLGVNAFAAEDTGSITISNATVGQTYAPYKIFDASISGGEDGGFIYSITPDNQFFDDMFGTDGTKVNPYFAYNDENGFVTKKEGVADADVLAYLKSLIYVKDTGDQDGDGNTEELIVKAGLTPTVVAPDTIKPAEDTTVVFDNLPYGYYLITSTLGTAVTINSTDPDVVVIDKNQKPGNNFDKLVWDEDTGKWVKNSSANIGDIVDFKVEFDATNYNGDKLIKHYIVGDNKGDALWVEFNSIKVTINGVSAGKGWYHCTNNDPELKLNTGEWINAKNEDQWAETANDAGWYLIHNGYDEFDIIIPWVNEYTFTSDGEAYELIYPENIKDITSKYLTSPSKVVIEYEASVEPTADIDGNTNLFNEVDLSWQDKTLVTYPDKPKTDLTVHAVGITKRDGETGELLAGAIFKLYSDEDCTKPVYVIPTDVKGVYILDDLKTAVSGENRETSREKYAAYLEAYLNGAEQKNEVETQLNGKLVVLGLEKGTYYLMEAEAPDGYNKLATAVVIEIDGTTESYTFMTNDKGEVVKEDAATEEHIYTKVEDQPVENNKGVELPSTGGKGTMLLITIGFTVAMAFAVLLITHKKMSIYHD